MAVTTNKRAAFNAGNKKQVLLDLTTTTGSGIVDTGLSYVEYILVTGKSMATAGINLKPNLGSAATAINGRINFNSAAAGDDFFVICYGK